MSREFSVARHQHRLIGYWGDGDGERLAQDLARMLKGDGWVITQPAASEILSLSAAGLPPDDVWVRVDDNCLTLGREAFGRVTLYWLQIEQMIWFASEFQLLLPLVESPRVSIPGLYGYSCFSYLPTPLTPIVQIMAVGAGTEQVFQTEGGNLIQQSAKQLEVDWCESSVQITDESVAVGELQTLLIAAMERQIADLRGETVGVFLSGGLDSAIVAALLVRAGVKVQAYSLDFGTAGISEYPYAEQVAEYLKIPLVKVDATAGRVKQAVLPTMRALDIPFGDGVTVPLYLLNQAASRDVRVVFNGEGGDQLFAGWTNKPLIAASIYGGSTDFIQPYLQTFHRLYGYSQQSFQPQMLEQTQFLNPADWISDALNPTFAPELLHRLRRASLMLKGAQNIHPRATNLAQRHGLKVRSIFCDPELTAWTFGISGTLHLQGACEKYILKRAVENLLPADIVWRTKRGMGVPLNAWLLQDLWGDLGR